MSLCNDAHLNEANKAEGEPTEAALVNYGFSLGLKRVIWKRKRPGLAEAPFDSGRKLMSTIHKMAEGSFTQYVKGLRCVDLPLYHLLGR